MDGRRRGERKCIHPKVGDADFVDQIWEEMQLVSLKEILVEVEHVKGAQLREGQNEMTHFEKFVTDGNEKADELAKGRIDDV